MNRRSFMGDTTMAKMLTKSETKTAGGNAARKDAVLASMTAYEIDSMDYNARLPLLQGRLKEAAVPVDVDPKYYPSFNEGFIDEAQNILSNKLRALRNARERWRRCTSGISYKEAVQKVHEIVKDAGVRGVVPIGSDGYDGLTVRLRRAGGEAEASIYIRIERDYDDKVVNPDNEKESAGEYELKVELSWSSSSRSIEEALTCAELYRDAATLASEIVTGMRRYRICWTYGIEGKEEE